jgi:hypothetical protein
MNDAPPRPDALSREHFTLTIDDVLLIYERAGFARPRRRIQKYCARGDLECLKIETQSGEKYLITTASVDRHLALIKETDASRRGQTRPDAPERAPEHSNVSNVETAAPPDAPPRPDAPDNRYVEHLEEENKFLRGELTIKNDQIKQANVLTQGLQRLIAGLTRTPDPLSPPSERSAASSSPSHAKVFDPSTEQ